MSSKKNVAVSDLTILTTAAHAHLSQSKVFLFRGPEGYYVGWTYPKDATLSELTHCADADEAERRYRRLTGYSGTIVGLAPSTEAPRITGFICATPFLWNGARSFGLCVAKKRDVWGLVVATYHAPDLCNFYRFVSHEDICPVMLYWLAKNDGRILNHA